MILMYWACPWALVFARSFWWCIAGRQRMTLQDPCISCLVNVVVQMLAKVSGRWAGRLQGFRSLGKALLTSRWLLCAGRNYGVGARYPGFPQPTWPQVCGKEQLRQRGISDTGSGCLVWWTQIRNCHTAIED